MRLSVRDKLKHNERLTEAYQAGRLDYDTYKKAWQNITEKEYNLAVKNSKRRNAAIRSRIAERYILPQQQPSAQAPTPLAVGDKITLTSENRTYSGEVYQGQGGAIAVGVRTPSILETPKPKASLPSNYVSVIPSNPIQRALINNPSQAATEDLTGSKSYYDTSKITIKRQQPAGVQPSSIGLGSAFRNTTLIDRVALDIKTGVAPLETFSREIASIDYGLSEKAIKTDNKALSFGYSTARTGLTAVTYPYTHPKESLTFVGLGLAFTGIPGVVGGAFPKVAPAITGITKGIGAIGGALYIPSIAKGISETSDIPKYTGQRLAEIGLVRLGSIAVVPKYKATITDSSSPAERISSHNKVVDITKIRQEVTLESQYLKQTTKLTGSEKQIAKLSPLSKDQILTKSNYYVTGEVNYQPQGASKFLRGIFTKQPVKPSYFNVIGTSSGVFNLGANNLISGITEIRQTQYSGRAATKSVYFSDSLYRADLSKDGLMQFSGVRSSTIGGSSEFRGTELLKQNIFKYGGADIESSIILNSERGFINSKQSYTTKPLSRMDIEVKPSFKTITPKTGNTGKPGALSSLKSLNYNVLKNAPSLKNFNINSLAQGVRASTFLAPFAKTATATAQSQKTESLTAQTSKISIVSKAAMVTKVTPSIMQKSITASRTITNTRTNTAAKTFSLPKSFTSQYTGIAQATKTSQIAKVTTIPKINTTTITPIITITPGPTPPPPPVPPPSIMNFGIHKKRSFGRSFNFNQVTNYRPTLRSLVFNIRGKRPKVITPFSNRPILL